MEKEIPEWLKGTGAIIQAEKLELEASRAREIEQRTTERKLLLERCRPLATKIIDIEELWKKIEADRIFGEVSTALDLHYIYGDRSDYVPVRGVNLIDPKSKPFEFSEWQKNEAKTNLFEVILNKLTDQVVNGVNPETATVLKSASIGHYESHGSRHDDSDWDEWVKDYEIILDTNHLSIKSGLAETSIPMAEIESPKHLERQVDNYFTEVLRKKRDWQEKQRIKTEKIKSLAVTGRKILLDSYLLSQSTNTLDSPKNPLSAWARGEFGIYYERFVKSSKGYDYHILLCLTETGRIGILMPDDKVIETTTSEVAPRYEGATIINPLLKSYLDKAHRQPAFITKAQPPQSNW